MCSIHATTSDSEKISDEESDLIFEERKHSVNCICPKCGISHILKIFWTGKGTPRKYCHRCREVIGSVNEQYIYETVPDVYRVHRGTALLSNDG